MTEARPAVKTWRDACRAAFLLAVDPVGLGGVALRASAGEARTEWLKTLRGLVRTTVQVPADASAQQLIGGLDLEQTLAHGRIIAERGALARADGSLLVVAMAERMTAATAATITAAMDQGVVAAERDGVSQKLPARFGVVALDEGIGAEERPPVALLERLSIHLDLADISHRDLVPLEVQDIAAARLRLADVRTPEGAIEALCGAASSLGVTSGRAPILALRVARANAALANRSEINEDDIIMAARMVLGPRAVQLPVAEQGVEPQQAEEQQEEQQDDATPPEGPSADDIKALEDVVLDAAVAAIPAGLLHLLQQNAGRGQRGASGKAGDVQQKSQRGRPISSRRGDFRSGARLDLLDTLRSAAPWQNFRRSTARHDAIQIRREDIRIKRFKDRQASTTIFVVDASGSTAMDRLGEAKGAVEMLLSDCYVRRDEVALIAFRGAGADLLLPATRSLTRAKRSLAALPGGGGTPLASGLAAAERLAEDVKRKGRTPTLVVITDGRANVARDGLGGRERAQAEAEQAADVIRLRKLKAIVVDNSPRPEPKARGIAEKMGAVYLPLPHVNAAILSDAVRQHANGLPTGVRP